MNKFLMIILSVSLMLLVGCSNENITTSKIGLSSKNDSVSIGVALNYEDNYDIYKLALEDIQKLNSPIDINLEICYDNEDYTMGLSIAQDFSSNENMVGVVGHLYTDVCLSLKNVYEKNKMTLLVPTVNSTNLLDENEEYIYQTVPDMLSESRFLTAISYFEDDVKNAVIIYSDTDYGNEFSKTLENTLTEDKIINIIDKVCAPNVYNEFPVCMEKWKSLDFDTVFLTGNVDLYQYYIPKIKEYNPNIKIYISFDMESYILNDEAYHYYDNVYQIAWAQYDYNAQLQDLYKRFESKFGETPTSKDIQVYDNIMIIAKAIAYENVRTSEDLKNFLDNSKNVNSIFGENIYFKDNLIQNKTSFIQNYDKNGLLTNSYYLSNNDIYEIWYDYYSLESMNKYLKMGDYNNEK